MDESCSSLNKETQQTYRKRIKQYQADIAEKEQQVQAIKDASISERENLIGDKKKKKNDPVYYQSGGNGDGDQQQQEEEDQEEMDFRKKLISNQKRLERTQNSVKNSITTMEQTIDMGTETAALLKEQGDQMRRTINKVL